MPYGCLSGYQIRVKTQADRCELWFPRKDLQVVQDVQTKLQLAIITFRLFDDLRRITSFCFVLVPLINWLFLACLIDALAARVRLH